MGKQKNRVIAIVPAAGLGKRFGPGTNKPFLPLGGKPLIVWALETLESLSDVAEIIPVLKQDDREQGQQLFEKHGFKKIKKIVTGGKERQDSVYHGLHSIEEKACLVLIHDGARPLIEKAPIEQAFKEMSGYDGVVLGVPVKDTIKEIQNMLITHTFPRASLWAIQTPQIFPYRSIVTAYEKAMKNRYYATDDAALIEKYGGKVKIIMGSYRNIKITTPEDLVIAEALLKEPSSA